MPSRTRLGARVIVGPLHFFVGWGHRSALRTVGPDQNVETGETVLDVKRSGRSFGTAPVSSYEASASGSSPWLVVFGRQ